MSETITVEVVFNPKDGNACLYDFRDFAVVLTYLVEDAFMPLGISFEILLGEKYRKRIKQWMDKFHHETTAAGARWEFGILEIPTESVEKLRRAAKKAEHHFDRDNIMGKSFTKVFPNFPN